MTALTIASGYSVDNISLSIANNVISINTANSNTYTINQQYNISGTSGAFETYNFGTTTYNFGFDSGYLLIQTVGAPLPALDTGIIYQYNGTNVAILYGTGVLSISGIKTSASASSSVSVGASPFTYTNSSSSNQQVFIQGGTVSAISFNPNGVSGISLSGLTDNILTMRPNDTLTITYTSAPTINTIQL